MGVAGLAIISSTKKINAQLAVTGITLGATTAEMRALTLATTNVTFPIKEVTATFDLLARAGVKDQKVLKDVATAFDTLGDAISVPASIVTAQLVPAMKTFNIDATTMAAKTDSLTWLFRNTTVNLEDFNRMVGYTTPELVEMGLTVEDMIAILAELEEQGYSGEVMTREFRKAVTDATKAQIPLNEALGITSETIAGYKAQMDGAKGITDEYAAAANTQYTIMDKLKQKWSELTLKASAFLEPMEPILAGMTALGPLMIGMSMMNIPRLITGLGGLTRAFIAAGAGALKAAAGFVIAAGAKIWAWAAAIPFVGIGLAIAGVAALAASIYGIKRIIEAKEGGIFTRPTLALVGEAGPEAVVPLRKLGPEEGGIGGVLITGNTFIVREEEDIERVARELYRIEREEVRARGG